MSTETANRRYETRRKDKTGKSTQKSRVDWRRTKRDISQVLASEEDECSSSEDQREEHIENSDTTDGEEEQQSSKLVLQMGEAEEECISPARRKRMTSVLDDHDSGSNDSEPVKKVARRKSTTSVLYDHDSSSDDSEPVRKVFAKRRCIMEDESSDGENPENDGTIVNTTSLNHEYEGESSEEMESATTRKRKRLGKLKELSQKLLNVLKRNSSVNIETSEGESFPLPLTPTGTSDQEDEDNQSLSSFIVEDEEEESSESANETQSKSLSTTQSLFLEHHIPLVSDPFVHFQRIVKAFLINAMDDTFLISLFDGARRKRYAKEMIASFNHLDDRVIAPRLENLKSRSRWKEQYKERVESYPFITIVKCRASETTCHACGLRRWVSFEVILSGELYNNKTLVTDDFMKHDRQILKVGTICAERTRVYHQLKHFKYYLHKQCISIAKVAANDDVPVKDTVNLLFSRIEGDWIKTEYDILERYLNEADYFHEEMVDSMSRLPL